MLKAGLITGILAIVVAVAATSIISPLCSPCAVLFLGVLAGYLAGVFDRPSTNNAATKAGALGGTIGGIGALIGQLIGTALNGYLMGPEGAANLVRNMGLPTSAPQGFDQIYWASLVGSGLCLSVLDIVVMAGFGAVGGILWWQVSGKNGDTPFMPSTMPPLS